MPPVILVTGATGTLGRDLVPWLLARSDAEILLLLRLRAGSPESILRRTFGLVPSPRVRVVWGDLTRSDLGLDRHDLARLARSVTHVLHAGASTRFDLPWEEAQAINTGGTRRVAALAERCTRLERFGFVSTAYVSGRRTGAVREPELEHGEGFVNTYERSKYEAERLLRGLCDRLPIAVYRLSTVCGDSRTGAVHAMAAPHQAMKVIHMGLASLLPGRPDYRVDLIAGDHAASAVGRLFLERFHPGETFHLTAAPEKSCTLAELVELTYDLFDELQPEWGRRRYPRPAFSSASAFDLFADSVERTGNAALTAPLRTVRHFARQLAYPKSFDRSNVLRALPTYDADQPDVRDYYRMVVRYCLQTRWGKHAA